MAARIAEVYPDFLTIRKTSKRGGPAFSEKKLRRAVKEGELPAYYIGDSQWPQLYWPEVVAWARRRRVPATRPSSHVEARLAEVLERERRAGL